MTSPSPLALALGRIPTGLYIVTTLKDGRPIGFVGSLHDAGRFRSAGRHRRNRAEARAPGRDPRERGAGVSVLDGAGQKLMAPFFKRHEPGRSPFDQIQHRPSPAGLPLLAEALAWLECRVTGEHATGDHVVVFGVVEHGDLLHDGDPAVRLRKDGLDY
jgi:3-hydroxy-9,10-secoandrosta-1,3,5(10)-triene-9,17-dione monooxygenase reductase component